MTIHLIAAARPNFMKIAPLYHELSKHTHLSPLIVHTGQHFDKNMSDTFFEDFNLPTPHIHLGVCGGTHAESVGQTMMAYEKVCIAKRPDFVIVVGDVNATAACAITAKKLGIRVAHLEAGIRSFDMSMPEEINRRITDAIVDEFWTPSVDANENLVKEGIDRSKIKFVGNIMIDSLEMMKHQIVQENTFRQLGLTEKKYIVATFHRPSNVDHCNRLSDLVDELVKSSMLLPIVFPIHPRTKSSLEKFELMDKLSMSNVIITEPLGYKKFMNLVFHSQLVLTDSGGIQEETTYLGIPCLTLRENTERPITVWEGTNTLVEVENITKLIQNIVQKLYKKGSIPLLWDGKTAERIAKLI